MKDENKPKKKKRNLKQCTIKNGKVYYDDLYYVMKIPLLASKFKTLRENGILVNEGMWGAFKYNQDTEMLEPLKEWIDYFPQIQYRRTGFENISIYPSKKKANHEARRRNKLDWPGMRTWWEKLWDWIIRK